MFLILHQMTYIISDSLLKLRIFILLIEYIRNIRMRISMKLIMLISENERDNLTLYRTKVSFA
jgi:hypothetical protein